jgi:hypothetical protein
MDEPFIGQPRQIASTKPRHLPGKLTAGVARSQLHNDYDLLIFDVRLEDGA